MNEQLVHHFPPELMALLIDAIPRLIKGKRDVLNFFKGCGVDLRSYANLQRIVAENPKSITKFEIVRQLLTQLNDRGDSTLAQRRKLLQRVTEWDDFSGSFESDRMPAMGFVAEIRRVVNVKDSFTRIDLERAREREAHSAEQRAKAAERQRVKTERDQIKRDLCALFDEVDASKRGIALEGVLNRLFKSHGILIREAFRRVGTEGEGVIEQIDGVVELDGNIYLVEMKWRSEPLGRAEVSAHLVGVFNRRAARGILISQSGYTEPAITTCRESLSQAVFVLAKLEELVFLLERDGSLVDFLKAKVQAAVVEKNPLIEPLKVAR